jgi:hypothetical protein
MRLGLEANPRLRRGRRADPLHSRDISEDETETFGPALPTATLTAAEARDFRSEMAQRFGLCSRGGAGGEGEGGGEGGGEESDRASRERLERLGRYMQDEGHFLDQQTFAACSFAGFLQLLNVSSSVHATADTTGTTGTTDECLSWLDEAASVPPSVRREGKRWDWWRRNWDKCWVGMLRNQARNSARNEALIEIDGSRISSGSGPVPGGGGGGGGGERHVSDVASMLDLLPFSGKGGGKGKGTGKGGAAPFVLPSRFVYLPIRSAGSSEMCFERSYWKDDSIVATAFNVPVSSYREMPWTYQTAYLLEGLLSRGIPVAFNSDVHTRVAIAFDATHVLCLDR